MWGRWVLAVSLVGALVLTACGGGDSKKATATIASGGSVNTPPVTQGALSADSALDGLMAKGMPVGERTAYTAENDPNHLLGRPGGYTSKVAFTDTRLDVQGDKTSVSNGGSVEVFPTDDDAKRRTEYVSGIAKSSPLFSEYTYQHGRTVLRLSARLTPDQAAQYQQALQTLPAK